ncbi:hypothetical protein GX51_01446 [Blastomyces parvus]|uniref:Uncharacterized protein n=1 Tax=Blastomyces parvus TaxID=2060905 RepID=A0A2B7XFU8_9EURO|nr:hypothetical protein GX51_01446 [Blastomyces parvus]
MHIQEDTSESSGGSTSTCTSSSSYMEPGALYVQRQPSGKPAFVRRPTRYKTPGALLADALYNPRPIVQKHRPYQAPEANILEPANAPEPQQMPVPPYQQFQQYSHPQQQAIPNPNPNPLASFPNDMAQSMMPIAESCGTLYPEWKREGGNLIVLVPHCFWGPCSTPSLQTCYPPYAYERHRRKRDSKGSRRGRNYIERRDDCDCTSEDSCGDSCGERDIPVKKPSHKHKKKGKGKHKSFLRKCAHDVSDTSDEEGHNGRVRFREPVRRDTPGANLVGSGIYDPKTGTVHHANRSDGCCPPNVPFPLHPDSNATIPTYQPSHRPPPEWVPRTYYDDDRRNYEWNTDGEGADSRGRGRRRRVRSTTPPPSPSHNRPRDTQYPPDNRRYSREERGRSPGRPNIRDTYYDPPNTPYHSDYRYARPRSPDRYEQYLRDPPRGRSYSRRRPMPGPPTPGPHYERPRVVEMRPDRRPDELDPPTRARRGY